MLHPTNASRATDSGYLGITISQSSTILLNFTSGLINSASVLGHDMRGFVGGEAMKRGDLEMVEQ